MKYYSFFHFFILPILCTLFLCVGCKKDNGKSISKEENITDPKTTEVWTPIPMIVEVPLAKAPSDAVILFDGTSLSAWESVQDTNQSNVEWKINSDGSMTVNPGTGDIRTKRSFGDVQIHLEWRSPREIAGEGQGRGNSGIFLQERYEIQILDNYQNKTYVNGQAASLYKQHPPLVNASRPPGEWQSYDIIFHAPVFTKQGKKIKPATLTLLHNGVLVQDHVEVFGTTEYIGNPKNEPHMAAPIKLQDHGNLVSYRNIWIRAL